MDLSFLKANRFWAAVILGLVFYLEATRVLDSATATALKAFLVSFITVRTVDRFSEKVAGQ
jgi:hypothetical protein